MVFDLGTNSANERLTAFLTAKLTTEELDAIQAAFGRGAVAQSYELFIKNNPEYHNLSHAEIRKAEPGEDPLLVIDKDTPSDGGIWYLAQFATEDEVEDGEAESEEVLWKIRIKVGHIPTVHANYDIGNQSIREDLDNLDVDYPAPVDYTHSGLLESGISNDADQDEDENGEHSSPEKWLPPTWVILEPGEYEESTDAEVIATIVPRQEVLYRIKPEVAKAHGLKLRWTVAGKAKPVDLPDGTKKTFPDRSISLQADYDLDSIDWNAYKRPEGSL
ncbi:hypothetical protein K504DRAFT_399506 [Pleomassaria siparia CBS 279.74]|uniref:Uncharacterized protein n=1 Tax=Pleomassaria siparia CBS 279.74 TaxID=1314801 RepID=A0A6G1KNC9_9PLEO|nr:hypothetical protein K504DRAFT_399506 [Pleomassaria siparia CBS 279.74]